MAGTGDLLGQLIGAALGSGSVRGGGAQQGGGGLPGGLGDILGQVLGGGGQRGGSGGAPSGLPGGLGDILGQVLGGGGQRGGSGGAPSGLPGGLGDILGQVLGGGRGAPQGGPSGGASGGSSGGLEDILGQILGGGRAGGPSGGSTQGGGMSGGTGGDLGDFASDALGRGGSGQAGGYTPPEMPSDYRQPQPSPQPGHQPSGASGGGSLIKYGGLAVIGMLAWKALRKWQAGSGGRSAFSSGTPDAAFSPAAAPGGPEAFSGVLLSAMAAAAQADGEIDEDEVSRIGGGLERMGAGSPERDALIAILTTPVDPNEVVAAATTPEAALQIYAASALAIRPDNDAEHAYLDWLAGALGIDPGLKAQIDGELNA
ncbi:tellurite resistance TerB family protein [Xanthobacter sp. YC-JY1]|uniref:tellurite resistance TerB family protein n=1 Tax=Xanthobacter sp. YC-JY1 TaxID=2419844 RepID=UPI001F2205D8|nr:tellurite resistance TerB family protein [Xanthobacter sp. YC-JY1]UJX44907.1 tellurite resistance TerB family protein [Xanthobacter sp. YC-JY1]